MLERGGPVLLERQVGALLLLAPGPLRGQFETANAGHACRAPSASAHALTRAISCKMGESEEAMVVQYGAVCKLGVKGAPTHNRTSLD